MRVRASMLLAGAVLVPSACASGGGGGVIEENVVRPGITAIEEAPTVACGADVQTITAALQSYEMLEGSPATDESALVAAGYLRSPSDLVDVDNGRIVAQHPDCAAVVPAGSEPAGTQPVTS